MYAILNVLEDARKKTLCFATKEDVERFKSFVNIYMDESGAGNGYGAYWVFLDEKIIEVNVILDEFFTTEIKSELIESMLDAVLVARLADNDSINVRPTITISKIDGGLTFSLNMEEFPSRLRPTKGDMFRTLESMGAEEKFEGRVLEDNAETLNVIDCWDEDRDGSVKKDAKVITINANQVMKINDWKKKHRELRN